MQGLAGGRIGRTPATEAIPGTELPGTPEASEEGLVRRDAAGADRENPGERAEVATTDQPRRQRGGAAATRSTEATEIAPRDAGRRRPIGAGVLPRSRVSPG